MASRRTYSRWTRDRLDLLIKLREAGVSVQDQAAVLGVTVVSIRGILCRFDEYKIPRLRKSAAVGEDIRIAVYEFLYRGPATRKEISAAVDRSKNAVLEILKELTRVGMVRKYGSARGRETKWERVPTWEHE